MSYFGQDPYGYVYVQPGYYSPYSAQYQYQRSNSNGSNTSFRERRKPKPPKDNAQMWCDICAVGCIGQQSYAEHCNGKKHQALARKGQSSGTSSSEHSPPTVQSVRYSPYDGGLSPTAGVDQKSQGKYHCEICNVYSTDQNTFNLHLSGKKHKTTVLRVSPSQLASLSQSSSFIGDGSNNSSYISMPRFHIPAAPKSSFTPMLISQPSNLAEDNLLNSNIASLSPTPEDIRPLAALITAITAKLDEFKVPLPEGADELTDGRRGFIIDLKMVGPYARGTLIKGFICADMVVITKEPPDFNMLTEFQKTIQTIPEVTTHLNGEKMDLLIKTPEAVSVHIMFTWTGADEFDIKESSHEILPPSPPSEDTSGVNVPACQKALMMVHQTHFFSDNSLSPNLRPCLKIIKDLQTRMPVFAPLSSWAIEVIIINALRTVPLSASLSQSLRAIFAFMASGMLLPGVELIDPCAPESDSVLANLSNQERLDITEAAQKILNDLSFGKWEEILGI